MNGPIDFGSFLDSVFKSSPCIPSDTLSTKAGPYCCPNCEWKRYLTDLTLGDFWIVATKTTSPGAPKTKHEEILMIVSSTRTNTHLSKNRKPEDLAQWGDKQADALHEVWSAMLATADKEK